MIVAVLLVITLVFVSAQSSRIVNVQYTQPSYTQYYSGSLYDSSGPMYNVFWPSPVSESEQCSARQDFVVQIAPGGCEPAVVRSDLLAEQNVPVFCQLIATKINPLVEVESIDHVDFPIKQVPKGVVGIGYHPAQAALKTSTTLLGSPVMSNIGYAVVVLKKTNEKNQTSWVEGNLTAHIKTNYERAWGIGTSEFYIPVLSDDDWNFRYKEFSFWGGKGYVRVNSIEADKATVSIYSSSNSKISTVTVLKNQLSKEIYLPGFFCKAALQISLNDITTPETSIRLKIDENVASVVKGGSFLNSKCRVTNIREYGIYGEADISCPGGSFTLKLNSADVTFEVSGSSQQYSIGSRVGDKYLLFAGELPSSVVNEIGNSERFITILGNEYSESIRKNTGSIIENLKKEKSNSIIFEDFRKKFQNQIVLVKGDENKTSGIKFTELSRTDKTLEKTTESYLNSAKENYLDVVDKYSSESDPKSQEIYGIRALIEAEDLAEKLGQSAVLKQLYEKQISVYGDDADIQAKLNKLQGVESKDSVAIISIDNQPHIIEMTDINTPGLKESSIEIDYFSGGKSTPYVLQAGEYIGEISNSNYIKLVSFSEDGADFSYSCNKNVNGQIITESKTVRVLPGNQEIFCSDRVSLKKININKYAKLSIIPKAYNQDNYANFTFKIGIEQRAIQLSDEKTKEMIASLDQSIAKWENIVNKTGSVVSGLKAACLATSALFTVNNLISGFSGDATARTAVMKTWRGVCTKEVSEGKFEGSMDKCYSNYESEINKDIAAYKSKIGSENTLIKSIENQPGFTNSGILGDTNVNTLLSGTDYYDKAIKNKVNAKIPLTNERGNTTEVDVGKILSDLEKNSVDSKGKAVNPYAAGKLSYDEMKKISLDSQLINDATASPQMKEQAKQELGNLMQLIEKRNQETMVSNSIGDSLGISVRSYDNPNEKFVTMDITGKTWRDIKDTIQNKDAFLLGLPLETRVDTVQNRLGGKTYLNILQPDSLGKEYNIIASYELTKDSSGIKVVRNLSEGDIPKIKYQMFDSYSYMNKFINAKVKYFATDPYKGMPSVVPFDLVSGWYAAVKQTLPVFGNSKSYDASGRVSTFWLCNVGKNGVEQFNEGMGDDICREFDTSAGQALVGFPGLSAEQTKQKASDGIQALNDAASQSSKAKAGQEITILGKVKVKVGDPAANVPEMECQNFMSPTQCSLLFNVCDPVICPTSRCNLGGNYYASNVIQTGIIGGLVLCLPNFGNPMKGGVVIPLCLSGINAGLDNYVQILRAEKSCLNESLRTGNYVGICDQITSVYKCEFFWRQLAPLLNNIIPSIISSSLGQGTKGGGEYMSVGDSWKNAENTISYLRDYYGKNSFSAFQARSTEEAGTEICKSFVSLRYPNSFKVLLQPDSPTQFTAWFEEIPFTTVTVPPTSQYKVFYNIYAGKDKGDYYSVYLKRSEGVAFYDTPVYYTVKTGYLAVGQTASESKDFTAPTGYSQLCVKVGYQEECGFKQVSTSYAVNALKDEYIKNQVTQTNIKTSTECKSGTTSLIVAGLNNAGGMIQESAIPALSERGIVRVCSTANPGTGVEESRWQRVGFCDNENIGCWIDKTSIAEAITAGNAGALNQTLSILQNSTLTEKTALNEQQAADSLERINSEIEEAKKSSVKLTPEKIGANLNELDSIIKNAEFNYQKAKALLLKARIYRDVTLNAFYSDEQARIAASTPKITITGSTNPTTPQTTTPAITDSFSVQNNKIYNNNQDTGLSFLKNGNEFIIRRQSGTLYSNIGTVSSSGEISFYSPLVQDAIMQKLQLYNFDGTKFILKTGTTNPIITPTTGTTSTLETINMNRVASIAEIVQAGQFYTEKTKDTSDSLIVRIVLKRYASDPRKTQTSDIAGTMETAAYESARLKLLNLYPELQSRVGVEQTKNNLGNGVYEVILSWGVSGTGDNFIVKTDKIYNNNRDTGLFLVRTTSGWDIMKSSIPGVSSFIMGIDVGTINSRGEVNFDKAKSMNEDMQKLQLYNFDGVRFIKKAPTSTTTPQTTTPTTNPTTTPTTGTTQPVTGLILTDLYLDPLDPGAGYTQFNIIQNKKLISGPNVEAGMTVPFSIIGHYEKISGVGCEQGVMNWNINGGTTSGNVCQNSDDSSCICDGEINYLDGSAVLNIFFDDGNGKTKEIVQKVKKTGQTATTLWDYYNMYISNPTKYRDDVNFPFYQMDLSGGEWVGKWAYKISNGQNGKINLILGNNWEAESYIQADSAAWIRNNLKMDTGTTLQTADFLLKKVYTYQGYRPEIDISLNSISITSGAAPDEQGWTYNGNIDTNIEVGFTKIYLAGTYKSSMDLDVTKRQGYNRIVKIRDTDGGNDIFYLRWNFDKNMVEVKAELATKLAISVQVVSVWSTKNDYYDGSDFKKKIDGYVKSDQLGYLLGLMSAQSYRELELSTNSLCQINSQQTISNWDSCSVVSAKDVYVVINKGLIPGTTSGTSVTFQY